jgi:general stress protein CsbA
LTVDRSDWRSLLLIMAVGLMFPLVNRLQQILPAAIHIGFGLGLGINLLAGRIFPSYWLVVGALTCSSLWLVSRKLPRIYALASDLWAVGIAGLGLSIGLANYAYKHFSWLIDTNTLEDLSRFQTALLAGSTQWIQSIDFTTLVATGILAAALVARKRWSDTSIPKWTWFWGLTLTIQLALSALIHLLGGDPLVLATANVLIAFPLWIWNDRQSQPESKLLPALVAGWGLLLRLPFFNAYTGLLTVAVGVVCGLTSRKLTHKSIGYGGMLLVTLGCYELITDRIFQAPSGGSVADALTVYGFVTAVLALGYRSGVWWQARHGRDSWWDFPLSSLKKVAHTHWAVASGWKVAAATVPVVTIVPQLTLLHLFMSVLLAGYALIQARDSHNERLSQREGGDWWIYLGLAELMGVGIYARSIFRGLGVVDEGLILIACLLGLLVLLAPWRQWGWHDRPWRMVALVLPLSRVVFEWHTISLLNLGVLAVFYAGVARRQRQFAWAYLSLIFVNWAGVKLLLQYQLTSPLWYATLVGLSILTAVQWDPHWQNSKQNRHYGRILGSGTIAVTALVWHQPWLPIGIGLSIAILGLVFRVRAWLYVGTTAFLLTNAYQLLVLITEYPITKWAIGLCAGVLIITLAANFERRKEQIERALQHWLDRLQEWE